MNVFLFFIAIQRHQIIQELTVITTEINKDINFNLL